VLSLLVAGATLVGGAAVASPAARADSVADQVVEGQFMVLLNGERTSQGLPALSPRDDLVAVARSWAVTMASEAVLRHNPDLTTVVTDWNVVGENVGYGPDVLTVHLAFMSSAGHRANILDTDYTEVGVGAVVVDGLVWVAEVFRRPALPSSPVADVSTGTGPMTLTDTTPGTTAAPGPPATTRTPTSRSPRTAAFSGVLRHGSTGPAVRRVQRRLGLRASGFYGHWTARRVVRFQHSHDLRATGVVGRRTWNRLF
jgi:hypothetical protein